MVQATVRRIGTAVCCTWENGNFTMLRGDEINSLPKEVLDTMDAQGIYEGLIPNSIYFAYLICESQGVCDA